MHQYLFFIGSFPIRSYGVFFALGIITGGLLAYYFTRKAGRYSEYIWDLTVYCGLWGIIGGRLWDVFFFDWDYYQDHLLEIPFVWQGGMAIQGGLLFGILAALYYLRKRRVDILDFADLVAPAIVLGQSVGRMANLMNGDAFGHPTGGSFGILYPETTLAYHTYGAQPLWPAEIWEGQIDVLIFVILLAYSLRSHVKGQVFALYIMLYSLARFGLEFLRGDYGALLWGLKSAQLTALVAFFAALSAFVYFAYRKPQNAVPPALTRTSKRNKK